MEHDHKWEVVEVEMFPTPVKFASCIVINETVYVAEKQRCYKYNNNHWNLLRAPVKPVVKNFSLGRLGEDLIMVGGLNLLNNGEKVLGTIQRYIHNDDKWEACPHDMPTPRCSPSVCCSDNYLVVSGGWLDVDKKQPCDAVEIFLVKKGEWKSVSPLPNSLKCKGPPMSSLLVDEKYLFVASSNICVCAELEDLLRFNDGHTMIVASGNCTPFPRNKSKENCPLLLMTSTQDHVPLITGSEAANPSQVTPWTPTADINGPQCHPMLALRDKCMMAVDGSKVFMYLFKTRGWCYVGDLPCKCAVGAAVAVLIDRFMLIGGVVDSKGSTSVYSII